MSHYFRGDGRGRHRKRTSRETQRWERLVETSDWLKPESRAKPSPRIRADEPKPKLGPAPARPSWLTPATYERLLDLRIELDHDAGETPAGRSTA